MPTYINVDHPIITATCEVDPPVLRIALSGELDMSCTRLVDVGQTPPTARPASDTQN